MTPRCPAAGSRTQGSARCRASVGLAALGLLLAAPGPAAPTTVLPKTFEQTAAEAESIFVGRVIDVETRWRGPQLSWMETEYTLAVDDAVLAKGPVAQGATVKLRFWGGTIGNETHGVAGLPAMGRGGRYVLMLRRDWSKSGTSPLVGFWHGFFPVLAQYGAKADVVVDHAGTPVFSLGGARIARYAKAAMAKDVDGMLSLPDFVRLLRTDLPRIKALGAREPVPVPALSVGPRDYARPLAKQAAPAPQRTRPPRGLAMKRVFEPERPAASAPIEGGGKAVAGPSYSMGVKSPGAKNLFVGYCKLPIVINPLPAGAAPWAPLDQECMSYWNFYLKDVFQVRDPPTAGVRWGDDSWDMHGMLSDAEFKARFRPDDPRCQGWDENVLGVTWYRRRSESGDGTTVAGEARIIEADVALNANWSWTLDDERVYDSEKLTSFRQTLTHELGHVLGLDHDFQQMAVMNYSPPEIRAFYLPFLSDVEAIRARYEFGRVHRTDLGIWLFCCTSGNDWRLASMRGERDANQVRRGGTLAVNHYSLQNLGTTRAERPTVEWYLTPTRNLEGVKHFLGEAAYPPLPPGRYFDPNTVLRKLTVPASVPPGDYYLAAFIRDDFSPQLRAFPWNNNSAFSRQKVRVTP